MLVTVIACPVLIESEVGSKVHAATRPVLFNSALNCPSVVPPALRQVPAPSVALKLVESQLSIALTLAFAAGVSESESLYAVSAAGAIAAMSRTWIVRGIVRR